RPDGVAVGGHQALAVRDRVEDRAVGHVSEPLLEQIRRRHLGALEEKAFALPTLVVAGPAVDVEALVAAREKSVVNCDRQGRERRAVGLLSALESYGLGQVAAGDRARDR